MPPLIETRSDCSRCAALCCIAYPSEEMPGFAARKNAGQLCPKLDHSGRCTIYSNRDQEGFAGCIQYECFGAGQHVVQHLFDGSDWRSDPALLPPMVDAFLAMRPVSDLLYLVSYARQRLDADQVGQLDLLCEQLTTLAQNREGLSERTEIARIERAIRTLFKSVPR